jgi:hypothetical protein
MNQAEFFQKNRPAPKYEFGARVFGLHTHKKVKYPFIGTVGSDGLRSELAGVQVTVTLDLPLVIDGKTVSVLLIPREDVSNLKEF